MRKFIYKSSNGQVIEFSKNSDFKITHIDGINAINVSLSEASAELQVGTQITGRKVEPRPITIEGDFKKRHLNRKGLIDAFAPLSTGRLTMIDDENNLNVYIDVEVKKTPFISEDCVYQKFQLHLYAPFPYWKGDSKENYDFFAYTSHFKFPRSFSNTVPFKISSRDVKPIVNVRNNGTVPTGFTAYLKTVSTSSGASITNIKTQQKIKMSDDYTLTAGKTLVLYNYQKELRIVEVEDETEKNVLGKIDVDATTFFELAVGDNMLQIDCTEGSQEMDVTIVFEDLVAGI